MSIAGSPCIFQEKVMNLMEELEYARTYINNLIVIMNSMFDNHPQEHCIKIIGSIIGHTLYE